MSKQILIIGGGVIGLCTAYYCARKGHQVTVLDRGTADDENCSYGNAGHGCAGIEMDAETGQSILYQAAVERRAVKLGL
jgi:glycine/D-amino acid oxidase-like deaminating enzyme